MSAPHTVRLTVRGYVDVQVDAESEAEACEFAAGLDEADLIADLSISDTEAEWAKPVTDGAA